MVSACFSNSERFLSISRSLNNCYAILFRFTLFRVSSFTISITLSLSALSATTLVFWEVFVFSWTPNFLFYDSLSAKTLVVSIFQLYCFIVSNFYFTDYCFAFTPNNNNGNLQNSFSTLYSYFSLLYPVAKELFLGLKSRFLKAFHLHSYFSWNTIS